MPTADAASLALNDTNTDSRHVRAEQQYRLAGCDAVHSGKKKISGIFGGGGNLPPHDSTVKTGCNGFLRNV